MVTSSADALDALTGKVCTCLGNMGTALSAIRGVVLRVRDTYNGTPGWQHLPDILRYARDGQQRIARDLNAIRELDDQHNVLELVREANLNDAPEFELQPGRYRTWTEAVAGAGAVPGIADEITNVLSTISDCVKWDDLTAENRIGEVRKFCVPGGC